MTTAERDELKRKAEAATPGPWEYEPKLSQVSAFVLESNPHWRGGTCNGVPHIYTASRVLPCDGSYIAAANPAVVLALLADLDAERARADAAEGTVVAMKDEMARMGDPGNVRVRDRLRAVLTETTNG